MKKELDNDLRRELIEWLSNHPPLQTPAGRHAWLLNLPSFVQNLIVNRVEVCEYDLAFIIDAIQSAQLLDGRWALLILIDVLLPDVEPLMTGEKLESIRHKIEKNLEPTTLPLPPIFPEFEEVVQGNSTLAHFVHRDEIIQEIRRCIDSSSTFPIDHIVLYGQPMVGKTKILERLTTVLADDFVPLIIDGHGCSLKSLEGFLWGFITQSVTKFNAWARHQPVAYMDSPDWSDFSVGEAPTHFYAYWRQLRHQAGNRFLVVMFDEIEHLVDKPEILDTRILSFVDDFVCNSDNGYFVLVGSERIKCSADPEFNALINKGHHIRVGYFDQGVTELCFDAVQSCVSFDDDALECITALCDGHPRFVEEFYRAVASVINNSPGKQRIGRSDIKPIVEEVLNTSKEFLLALWIRLLPNERHTVELVSHKPFLVDFLDASHCYLSELLHLTNQLSVDFKIDHQSLRDSILSLSEREWVEWQDENEEEFCFKLGIMPMWRRSDFVEQIAHQGMSQ